MIAANVQAAKFLRRHRIAGLYRDHAKPDPDRGSVVMAYIRLMPGVETSEPLARELQNYVKKNLAVYKYPRIVEFVDAYPLTSSGKISRRTLRARAAGAAE